MTTEELEQIRKIITEETVSKDDLQQEIAASENRVKAEFKQELKASEERLTGKIKDEVKASEARVTTKIDTLTDDMAEFFNKTWEKMEATTERVNIIEDHLGIADPNKN